MSQSRALQSGCQAKGDIHPSGDGRSFTKGGTDNGRSLCTKRQRETADAYDPGRTNIGTAVIREVVPEVPCTKQKS